MAHFAELGVNDTVIKTVYLDNIKKLKIRSFHSLPKIDLSLM